MSRDGRPPTEEGSRGEADDDLSAGAGSTSVRSASDNSGRASAGGTSTSGDPVSHLTERGEAAAPVWVRLTGAGMELAFIAIVFAAIGIAIDRHFNLMRPICSALGGLLGFTFGMVRFIRLANAISQAQRTIESTRTFDASGRADAPSQHDKQGTDKQGTDKQGTDKQGTEQRSPSDIRREAGGEERGDEPQS